MEVWSLKISVFVFCMKDRFKPWKGLLLCWACGVVMATPEQGCLRIVNAVGHGEGPLMVALDGRPLDVDGYAPGDVTGRIVLPTGTHQLRFERAGVWSVNVRVALQAGQSWMVIPYVEVIPEWRGSGSKYRLKVFHMASEDVGDRRCVTLLSLMGGEPLPLRVRDLDQGWILQPLSGFEPRQIEIMQLRGYLPMLLGRRRMASIPLGSAGNHIVVLYDSGDGKVASLGFKDHQLRQN